MRSAAGKVLILAASSLACAYAAATASLVTLQWMLPPTDGAYGRPLTAVWSDPFARDVAGLCALVGAAVGFPLATWALWRSKLSRSIPLVFGVAVLTAAITGPLGPLAVIFTLIASLVALGVCRSLF